MKDTEHTPAAPANVGDRANDTLRAALTRLADGWDALRVSAPPLAAAELRACAADLRAALAVAVPVPDEACPKQRYGFDCSRHGPAPAVPGEDRPRCNCATFGSAHLCPIHTQDDFDAAEANREPAPAAPGSDTEGTRR